MRYFTLSLLLALPSLGLADALDEALDDELEIEAELMEGLRLKERSPIIKLNTDDPDPVFLKEVEAQRLKVEKEVNSLQGMASKFAKTEKALFKINQMMLKASDTYLGPHNDLLVGYRRGVQVKDEKLQKKNKKLILRLRKEYIEDLKRVERSIQKLKELMAKMNKKESQAEK